MYASNEGEYNHDDNDWVFLRYASTTNNISHGAVNLVDYERSKSTSSSSSSSDSSSSNSDRSHTSSPLSSIESEHVHNTNPTDESDRHLFMENPVLLQNLISHDENDLLVTGEIKEEILSSETIIKQTDDTDTTPIINEYELTTGEYNLSDELVEPSQNLRQRCGINIQQTDDQHPLTMAHDEMHHSRPRRNNILIAYGILALFLSLPLILCRLNASQQLVTDRITEDLEKTTQHFNEINSVSMKVIEQKLTKQFEEKLQEMLNQKMMEHDQEKYFLILQVNDLYYKMHLAQENFTNTIHQLSDENERLQNQIVSLEQRLQATEQRTAKDKKTDTKKVIRTKLSTSLLEVLLGNLDKQTTVIAEDSSINLSDLFEHLNVSFNDFVEESKQKPTISVDSQVQKTFDGGMGNLSSSFHQAQSSYATWIRSRAQQREQARINSIEQNQREKALRQPWRWTFQRGQDRAQMRHQTPITKRHSSDKRKCSFFDM